MKGWSDADLAAMLKPAVSAETVRRWRSGDQTPYKYHITQMLVLFGVKHPKELDLDAQFNASTQSREEAIAVYRREFFEYLKATSIVAGVEPVVLLSANVDDPSEFLRACRVVLDECWDQFNQNRGTLADSTVTVLMPGLRELALKKSPHQHEAALLAIEARVLQILIATRKEDYRRRVSLGSDIVLLGESSGDSNLHAMAVGWHSNTYVNCYTQPETAFNHLNSVLPLINDVSPLNQTDIYLELSTACALDERDTDKEATRAHKYMELARIAMPDNPEADPLYQLIHTDQAGLDLREGKVNLVLARRFPSEKKYAQKAYESLVKSANKDTISPTGATRIRLAEASLCILDMDQFFSGLEDGLSVAIQKHNQRQISRAIVVLQKTPRGWRSEKRYKDLDAIVREIMTPTRIQRQNPVVVGQ
jgi:hypothetical protein